MFGVAVLATVFAGAGSYATGHAFVTGLVPALWVGVAVLAAAALLLAAVRWRAQARPSRPRSGGGRPPAKPQRDAPVPRLAA